MLVDPNPNPQAITVVFDTGSTTLWITPTLCTKSDCTTRARPALLSRPARPRISSGSTGADFPEHPIIILISLSITHQYALTLGWLSCVP